MGYVLAPWVAPLAVDTLKILIGPLSGAFAGAWAAQGIAKRNADTQRRLEELRATNAAVTAASSIANVCASLKRQHVQPLVTTYNKLLADIEKARAGRAKQPFEFQADLKTLLPFPTALPMLEKLLYDRISAPAGAMGLFTLLGQSLVNLQSALDRRNAIILGIGARPVRESEELAQTYFGLPDKRGHTDSRYPDGMKAIALYTDDSILFSYALAHELVGHAKRLAASRKKGFPSAVLLDFKAIEDAGLLPVVGESEKKLFSALRIEINIPRTPAT